LARQCPVKRGFSRFKLLALVNTAQHISDLKACTALRKRCHSYTPGLVRNPESLLWFERHGPILHTSACNETSRINQSAKVDTCTSNTPPVSTLLSPGAICLQLVRFTGVLPLGPQIASSSPLFQHRRQARIHARQHFIRQPARHMKTFSMAQSDVFPGFTSFPLTHTSCSSKTIFLYAITWLFEA
jgi:hypothetical protein